VSPLWPETVLVGLFPGHCWLDRPGAEKVFVPIGPGEDFAPQMLQELDALLESQLAKLEKGTRFSLTVSDSFSLLACLPWHAQLTSSGELHGYAAACIEKQGVDVGTGWTLHAEFRMHGGQGLAHAFPTAWLQALDALFKRRNMNLVDVLPVSARAYWKGIKSTRKAQELILLSEPERLSALIYDATGLVAMDVEPRAGQPEESGRRLLRRVAAFHESISKIQVWSTDLKPGNLSPHTSESFPSIEITTLTRAVWS
jgi:hypothetical protein